MTAVSEPTSAAIVLRLFTQFVCRMHRAVVTRCMATVVGERLLLDLRVYEWK